MDRLQLQNLLERVRAGGMSLDDALRELKDLPFADLGYAMVDHHRALRQGTPEVIFGLGKSVEQIVGIAEELARTGQNVLVTRLDREKAVAVTQTLPLLNYHELARTATWEQAPIAPLGKLPIALVCAGTADVPVAEECAETLRLLGIRIERLYDVGVAGIHRLLSRRKLFDKTALAIVVAGMEGALPSAVGGLVSIPVIAVPTSVGYGAAFGGVAALACMLTSCASGVTVCNIDNGFGAAFAAARILRTADRF
ncbi:MAG: nickel pincer cofactor biosynthesis protein LarB [Nitrospiraceae bacterium]|uniref:nickel pincer cofactor biosynthesis protein LarB n=1 Tax=Nitrospira cf. moscoviensis SBR1015 TaxID=96242 RepID=UPI000A0B27D0|nr:nickel pincer cofactor biosynthesis protein LarB [Nitrospira cf. moscoviensis SBR1015]MBY0249681.1 nickel pincer cofactor biosynthesis protein LarB [Nitrospiraceae bacterium]OQW33871.1 MAG: 1-(5-phosphoribosyl)-5-amino-4-imidazole-carboxylate carboxylase [Nitrospira sp. SG-bin2]